LRPGDLNTKWHAESMVAPSPPDQAPAAMDDHSPKTRNGRSASLRSYNLKIARDGTWFHEGRPIRRLALVKLFATVLRRDDDGAYWLQTPVERGRIEVEDAPFVAVELEVSGAGPEQRLRLRTNLDQWVTVDDAHPLTLRPAAGEDVPVPYVLVRDGLEARLLRPVYYETAERAVEQGGRLGVWSCGRFFPLEGG
jgi:uncharacterized protein